MGYLIVRCPERPDLRVYLRGTVVRLGKRVRVQCGLVHMRLGTYPLGTWYGEAKAVPVDCRALTEVTLEAGEPIDPAKERRRQTAGQEGPYGEATGSAPQPSAAPAPPTDSAGAAGDQ
ncbi:MAG: hypothetical protein JRI23_35455 [Deltaproteobacteria bacterium]|jgi:hypothetical protein|nr:hypothetical protein [Deltaproteobacteria bacterium]